MIFFRIQLTIESLISVRFSICHPERSEGPLNELLITLAILCNRPRAVGSFASLRMTPAIFFGGRPYRAHCAREVCSYNRPHEENHFYKRSPGGHWSLFTGGT